MKASDHKGGPGLDRETQQFYDQDAEAYDATRWGTPAGIYNNRTQLCLVDGLLPRAAGLAVEVGSGTGRFSMMLDTRSESLLLVDVALGMLVRARSRVGGGVSGVLGNVTSLPLADRSVAGLLCLNVLCHIRDYAHALTEISRVLAPGGYALLNFNNITSLYALPGCLVNWRRLALKRPVFSQWVTWSAFEGALTDAGLSVKNAKGHLGLPAGLPTPLIKSFARLDRFVRDRPRLSPYPFMLAVKSS